MNEKEPSTSAQRRPTRVAIVGAGFVGATFAYALQLSGVAGEIVLIDVNHAKAEGEAMDLMHSVPFASPTRIWAGDYADCAGATAVVITAGANQKPGETRLDLAKKNAAILAQIMPEVVRHTRDAIIVIATNPVDVLTYAALKLSGLPSQQVIGSGTILDTARFRALLGQHYGVDPRSVHAYIIGEHGDSEVPVWSLAHIAGMQLADFCRLNGMVCDQAVLDDIFERTRTAAYEIINRKGATYYAIGTGLLRIVEAIVRDQNTVFSVSSLISDYYGIGDICLSLPTVVDRGGAERVLRLELSDDEAAKLRASADVLRKSAQAIGM